MSRLIQTKPEEERRRKWKDDNQIKPWTLTVDVTTHPTKVQYFTNMVDRYNELHGEDWLITDNNANEIKQFYDELEQGHYYGKGRYGESQGQLDYLLNLLRHYDCYIIKGTAIQPNEKICSGYF